MAIAPYNYAAPQPSVAATPATKNVAAIKPFAYPAASAPATISVASAIKSAIAQTGKDFVGAIGSDLSQIKDAAVGSFKQGVSGVDTITSPQGGTPFQGAMAGANVEEGVAGVAFSPLAPITNSIGTLINNIGQRLTSPDIGYGKNSSPISSVLAAYGKDTATQDTTQDTATKILTALQASGNISMGILGAKMGEAKVPVETPTEPVKLPVAHAEPIGTLPLKPMGQAELPTIQMGEKAPTTALPTIQIGEKTPISSPVRGDLTVEPIKTAPTAPVESQVATEKPVETPTAKPTTTTQNIKPIEGTGDLKTRGLSSNVEATAIEKKLTDNFGDLPEYRQVSMADQAAKAADLISKNPEAARAIAMGDKAPPKGILPESVFVAVEHDATVRSDVQTLKDLANSKLASSATTMGQRIRTLGERDEYSPTAAIQDVQKTRNEAQAARGFSVSKEITKARSLIRKGNTKETWGDFVNSITC